MTTNQEQRARLQAAADKKIGFRRWTDDDRVFVRRGDLRWLLDRFPDCYPDAFATPAPAGEGEVMPVWTAAVTRELEKDDSLSTEAICKVYRAFKTVAERLSTLNSVNGADIRSTLRPFAMSVFADSTTVSGWRVGYVVTVEQQKAAHIAYFGKPTSLEEADKQVANVNGAA